MVVDAHDGVRLYYPLMRKTINPNGLNRQSGKTTRHETAEFSFSLQLFAAVSSSVRYQSIRIDSAEGESLLILSFDLIDFLYDDAVNSFRFFMKVAKPPEKFHPRLGVFSALGA